MSRLSLGCICSVALACAGIWASATAGAQPLPPVSTVSAEPSIREALALPEQVTGVVTAYEANSLTDDPTRAPQVRRWSAAHLGGDRVLFKLDLNREFPVAGSRLILYLDMDDDQKTGRQDADHAGVDVMVALADNAMTVYPRNEQLNRNNTKGRGRQDGDTLYLLLDVPLVGEAAAKGGEIPLRGYITGAQGQLRNTRTPHVSMALPNAGVKKQPPLPKGAGDMLSSAGYRYIGDRVAYEALSNKGLHFENISQSGYKPSREAPLPQLPNSGPRSQPAAVEQVLVIPVSVTEEAGVARTGAPVRFGFPLPKGAVFQPDQLSLSDADGNVLNAVAQVTALWPDGSLRWVALQLSDDFEAGQTNTYSVSIGGSAADAAAAAQAAGEGAAESASVIVGQSADAIRIDTGALEAVISLDAYRGLTAVRIKGQEQAFMQAAQGFVMHAEDGTAFSTANARVDQVSLEEQTEGRVTVRIAGAYTSAAGERGMSYVSRLTFHAGSGQVDLAHTTVNTLLRREFTDIKSLDYALKLESAVEGAQVLRAADVLAAGEAPRLSFADAGKGPLNLIQWDDRQADATASGKRIATVRLPGALGVATERGSIALAVVNFWQRWPKGLNLEDGVLRFDLLPQQPSADFGKDLPYHLQFPFVKGFYRLKWGMAFTERVVFDFSASQDAAALAAEAWAQAQLPLVAVLPGSWYAQTGALVPLAEPRGDQFSLWDDYFSNSFDAHSRLKDTQREYGFLNYGDWFGERGRNWGNNEYDLPHSLFSQFARTGDTRYFRMALDGVRHQADSDIVHAYPDPYYVGANHQHSIGHTGQWSQGPANATWSYVYDGHTSAGNGHTWADGMADAWVLAADPVVMEAALKLGDHMSLAFAPGFTNLGTHERSAGWSMRALMALYRATGDPLYLNAAGRIGETALTSQDMEKTGVWPHELPAGHADGRSGVFGNNVFLMGVLLNGLYSYHEETGDERYAESIRRAARWVSDNWDEAAAAWPYSATVDNEPVGRVMPGLNPLIFGGVLYGGMLADDPLMISRAEAAMASTFSGIAEDSRGKDISLRGFFTPETLGRLQRYYDRTGTQGAGYSLSNTPEFREAYLARQPLSADFAVRAPNAKAFAIESQGPATLKAVRSLFGDGPVRFARGSIRLLGQEGDVVFEDTFDTGGAANFEIAIPKAGNWRLLIDDNQRSIWEVDSPQAAVRSELLPGYRLGGIGTKRLRFEVPEGTKSFEVEVVGVHSGGYGVAVITPEGKLRGDHSGVNSVGNLLDPDMDVYLPQYASAVHRMKVDVKEGDSAGTWDLILWANRDIGVQLSGVPAYLFTGDGAAAATPAP